MSDILKKFIDYAPEEPGVYQMFSSDNRVLYIGKAKNIKKRLMNYLSNGLTKRILSMLAQVQSLEYTITKNEAEALLLESRLIKKHQPKYNILLKDDKSFPYILITTNNKFPQVLKYRGRRDVVDGKLFGPFANIAAVSDGIKFIQQTFKVRNCTDSFFAARTRPCLQHQIGRCSAPCVGKISIDGYSESIGQALKFLSGKTHELQKELSVQMNLASMNMEYERAAEIRDKIKNLNHIQLAGGLQDGNNIDVLVMIHKYGIYCIAVAFYRAGQFYGSKLYFPQVSDKTELSEVLSSFIGEFYQSNQPPEELMVNTPLEDVEVLQSALSQLYNHAVRITVKPDHSSVLFAVSAAEEGLKTKAKISAVNEHILSEVSVLFHVGSEIHRVEVYDNSHIMGSHAVGAMIVATKDGLCKRDYRIYNVTNSIGDDYAMLREVLERRCDKIKQHKGEIPDLMIIDGGKGHLAAALAVLEQYKLRIPVVAMSKGEERNAGREVFHLVSGEQFSLDRDDPVMKYLQILRDEAHNFAITNHRLKRVKAIRLSTLDKIPSIGAKRKAALMEFFGDVESIKAASIEDLMKVRGISRSVAQVIFEFFRHSSL